MSDQQLGSYYTLKVEGGEAIELKEGDIESVEFKCDSPDDATAKSNSMGIELHVSGEILHNKNESETLKLAKWALVAGGAKDVERKVTVELVKANKVVRQYAFSHAFVVDYTETMSDSGTGVYTLFLKQNRNVNDTKVEVNGGYDK